jgi:hypothetical protein
MTLRTVQSAIEKPPIIKNYRPGAAKPGPTPPLRTAAKPKTGLKFWEVVFRTGIIALVIISLLVAWWSFSVLKQRQGASAELSQRVNKVSAQVDALEREFTESQAAEITNKFNQAKATLFPFFTGPISLAPWWEEVKTDLVPLMLDAQFAPSTPVASTPHASALLLIPGTLTLEVQPPGGIELEESPYQRLLRIAQKLATAEHRADITGLVVLGGTNSASQATLSLQFWSEGDGL